MCTRSVAISRNACTETKKLIMRIAHTRLMKILLKFNVKIISFMTDLCHKKYISWVVHDPCLVLIDIVYLFMGSSSCFTYS